MESLRPLGTGLILLVVGTAVGALTFFALLYAPLALGKPSSFLLGWGWLAVPLGGLLAPVTAGLFSAWLLRRLHLPWNAVPGLAFAAGYVGLGFLAYFLFLVGFSSLVR